MIATKNKIKMKQGSFVLNGVRINSGDEVSCAFFKDNLAKVVGFSKVPGRNERGEEAEFQVIHLYGESLSYESYGRNLAIQTCSLASVNGTIFYDMKNYNFPGCWSDELVKLKSGDRN